MASVRLFVYGTLKRGERYHHELCAAPFLGIAETAPGYALVQLGDYLALVADSAGGVVTGELFEVAEDLLPTLDDFEGDAYERQNVAVKLHGAAEMGMALAYVKKTR